MLNFVSVCTETYPVIYAEKLHKRFSGVSNLNANHYCITDRPEEVGTWAKPLSPTRMSVGWWNKLNLFSPEMPSGKILYMDLDIVIIKNFDDEIKSMLDHPSPMHCVSDAVHWMGEKFSSSLMLFNSGAHSHIYEAFAAADETLTMRPGGDQVWVGPQLESINFVDEKFPNLKKNLKYHLAKTVGDQVHVPKHLPPEIKLVDCGGRPKPEQLASLPYIKSNWHDI